MDFTREDANNADRLNRILWSGMMGDRPYPGIPSGGKPAAHHLTASGTEVTQQ
jgi:hypothetical protein